MENTMRMLSRPQTSVYNYIFLLLTLFLTQVSLVLALDPSDEDTLKARLWLLFKTSKYQDALELTENNAVSSFNFERAYALYRLQREDDAASLLANADESDRAVLFLKAQIVGQSHNR